MCTLDLPVTGHGKGGRVNMNQQQAVIKTFAKDTTRDEDPREALLKYAELAENDPLWVSNGKIDPASLKSLLLTCFPRNSI